MESLSYVYLKSDDSIFAFTTREGINEAACILTDGRYNNLNEVYVYTCQNCEGYGFLNEEIFHNGEENQWLYGELCFECGGRGKLTFTEYFMSDS